ncbi:MAG: phosphotransferase [Candidatus Paracaedibacteraceae bacterium]|nr:phosphotransferase [Candidatus Paracaedibacteraceae bacterium]
MTLTAYEMKNTLPDFLKQHGLATAPMTFLAGDASPRQYFRLKQPPHTFVLMNTPASEKPQQFINIATLLTSNGFSAPQIVGHNVAEGFILLEDLQDDTFTNVLKANPQQASSLYTLATDTLLALAQTFHSKPPMIEDYSLQQFMEGAFLFVDWFYPATHAHPLSAEAKSDYEKIWMKVFEKADALPKTLILRDFHVDNLIYIKDRPDTKACGLLDFQDARWGPMVYDFVSLIDDVRVDIDPAVELDCWNRYSQVFSQFQEGTAERAITYMISASRLTRILGTFARLAKRDSKTQYLTHIPRIWRLLDKNLNHPELAEIKNWFNQHITVRGLQHD